MKTRNLTLDIIKLVASITVVLIHSRIYESGFDGSSSIYFQYLGRFAVPFFIVVGGYYYKAQNLNGLFDILKKMTIFYLFYNIINFIIFPIFGIEAKAYIKWFFYCYAILLLLTSKQAKIWLFFLFSISIIWNLGTGNVFSSVELLENTQYYEEFIVRENSAIVYMYLFIIGIWLRQIKIENNHRKLGIFSLLIAVVLILVNTFFLHYNQYSIFNSIIAICLLYGAVNVPYYSMVNVKTYYFDIFLYHCLMLPFAYLLIKPDTVITYLLFSSIVILFSLIFAYVIRFIDNQYFDQNLL